MTIFVGGIHAVGKTHLCRQLPEDVGLTHVKASELIRTELGAANWGTEKVVSDVSGNQRALIAAVDKLTRRGEKILLDGHFVLTNEDDIFENIEAEVFQGLRVHGILLLTASLSVIVRRRWERDRLLVSHSSVQNLADAELRQAEFVATTLGVPMRVIDSPTTIQFIEAIRLLAKSPERPESASINALL
jgi:adenylate kinase